MDRFDEIIKEWKEEERQENRSWALKRSPWKVDDVLISHTHPSCGLVGHDVRYEIKFHDEIPPDWKPTGKLLSTSADSRHKSRFKAGFEYNDIKYIIREKAATGSPWLEGTVWLLIEEAI